MKAPEPVGLSAVEGRFSAVLAWLTRGLVSAKGCCSSSKEIMKSSGNRGFTLLELIITIAIGLVMAGVSFIALMPLFKVNHVNAAYDTTLSVMRNYRNQSITQSKRYILTFTPPGNHHGAVLGRGRSRVARSGNRRYLYSTARYSVRGSTWISPRRSRQLRHWRHGHRL
jgi:prepilin-type N-terminal cleavage/methylation domain-containing protein